MIVRQVENIASVDPLRRARMERLKRRLLDRLDRFPYREPWWLKGAHRQTAYGPFLRKLPEFDPRRERWTTPDDDFLNVYFTDGEPGRPTVLMLHGLEGCRLSNYIVGMSRALERIGWTSVVMEHRSCGGEMNRARRLYHSGDGSDLDFAVRRLIERNPDVRLYIFAVSISGNIAAKWLGERGDDVPANVMAASIVSAPFDLTVSGPHVDNQLHGAYARRFLRTLIPKALEKERQYPGCLDAEATRRATTFREFDDAATAPLHGFRDHREYWALNGCGRFLHGVRRPTLLLSSADDPLNPRETLPLKIAERSPFLIPQFTEAGGHVGFVYGPPWKTRHWAEKQSLRFFRLVERDAWQKQIK